MATIIHQKLVRDRIPEIIQNDAKQPFTRVLGAEEFKQALRVKMGEEAEELLTAPDEHSVLEELADIEELVIATAAAYGYNAEDVDTKRRIKRKERGGFEQRILLEKVDSQD